jgi:hypothetical protein
MAKDYIPEAEGDFDTWASQFLAGIKTNMAALGLPQATVDAVNAAYTAWQADREASDTADAAARAAHQQQQKSRDALEKIARSTVHTINGNPAVDNALRAKAHLPPRDQVRSAIGAPATKPIGRLEPTGHSTLTLHFVDELTPQKSAKPHGVHGCEIWMHVGDPAPADATGYTHLAVDTRTPYVDVHPAADAGKTAYYMIRWVNTKGQAGPWGDVVSAKIPS